MSAGLDVSVTADASTSAARANPAGPRFPPWVWPNLLCLDAPAVAAAWQLHLCGGLDPRSPAATTAVLALVVWGVYLADRAFDASRPELSRVDRHAFARRHRPVFLIAAAAALGVAAVVALASVPAATLTAGLAVAAATGVYLLVVHALPQAATLGVKELAVGVVFAAGVGLPILAAPEPLTPAIGFSLLGFAALCVLNCSLITFWEDGPDGVAACRALAVASAIVAAGSTAWLPGPTATAVGAGLALLTLLEVFRGNVSVRARRVLADVALLTPLVAGPWT